MVSKEIMRAMATKEFSDLVAKDPAIKELEAKKYRKCDEFFSLMLLSDVRLKVCEIEVFPITPFLFTYLWVLDNAYATGNKDIADADTDAFMYLLTQDLSLGVPNGIDPVGVYSNSTGFCRAHGIEYGEATADLLTLMDMAFQAVKQLPQTGQSRGDAAFDVAWMVDICTVVAKQTNLDVKRIMFRMSLTECYYYYVSYLSQKGTTLHRISDEDITAAIFKRMNELGIEFYNKRGGEHGDKDNA